jgi:hypothetical protein
LPGGTGKTHENSNDSLPLHRESNFKYRSEVSSFWSIWCVLVAVAILIFTFTSFHGVSLHKPRPNLVPEAKTYYYYYVLLLL